MKVELRERSRNYLSYDSARKHPGLYRVTSKSLMYLIVMRLTEKECGHWFFNKDMVKQFVSPVEAETYEYERLGPDCSLIITSDGKWTLNLKDKPQISRRSYVEIYKNEGVYRVEENKNIVCVVMEADNPKGPFVFFYDTAYGIVINITKPHECHYIPTDLEAHITI